MSKNNLLSWLKSTEIPLTVISKKTNISRATLYNWINGGEIRNKSYNKVWSYYEEDIKITTNDIEIEGATDLKAQYIIDLQKDKIQTLEKENCKLQETLQGKTPESSHWDDLSYHYKAEVDLHFSGFGVIGRTINSVSDIDKQSEVLGYSEKELNALWDVGVKHKEMSKHPINKILHKSTTNELDTIGKTLPTVFNAIKDMIGNHYIPTRLMYICKDGSHIGAISYNKIDWKNQKVYSKIAFLIKD